MSEEGLSIYIVRNFTDTFHYERAFACENRDDIYREILEDRFFRQLFVNKLVGNNIDVSNKAPDFDLMLVDAIKDAAKKGGEFRIYTMQGLFDGIASYPS